MTQVQRAVFSLCADLLRRCDQLVLLRRIARAIGCCCRSCGVSEACVRWRRFCGGGRSWSVSNGFDLCRVRAQHIRAGSLDEWRARLLSFGWSGSFRASLRSCRALRLLTVQDTVSASCSRAQTPCRNSRTSPSVCSCGALLVASDSVKTFSGHWRPEKYRRRACPGQRRSRQVACWRTGVVQ